MNLGKDFVEPEEWVKEIRENPPNEGDWQDESEYLSYLIYLGVLPEGNWLLYT